MGSALGIAAVRKKPKEWIPGAAASRNAACRVGGAPVGLTGTRVFDLWAQQQEQVCCWWHMLVRAPHDRHSCYSDPALPLPADAAWLNVVALSALDAFRDLPDSLARSDASWRGWYDAEAPEALPVPDFETRLSKFERMCIVRCGWVGVAFGG